MIDTTHISPTPAELADLLLALAKRTEDHDWEAARELTKACAALRALSYNRWAAATMAAAAHATKRTRIQRHKGWVHA